MNEKWIRIWASHDSDGLWAVEPPGRLDPAALPISGALRRRLAKWMSRWPHVDLRGGIDELDRFAADGLKIAKAFKAELPDFKVNYHDWAVCARAEVEGAAGDDDPKPWDYEITG
jgi:hypothetical protein